MKYNTEIGIEKRNKYKILYLCVIISMKTVLLRKRYMFDDVPEDYRFAKTIIQPFPYFYKDIDILITDSKSFKVLAEDIIQAKKINNQCRVVVIADKTKQPLLSGIFPFLEYPDFEQPLVYEGIVTGRNTYRRTVKRQNLNSKEGDVLDAMSYGLSQKEIASMLGTSIRTIRRIQERILLKTGLENTKQLGIYSVAENWMSLNE